jgi:hypothetical protein
MTTTCDGHVVFIGVSSANSLIDLGRRCKLPVRASGDGPTGDGMKRATLTTVVGAAVSAAVLGTAAPAGATPIAPPWHVSATLSKAFVGPLQFAVAGSKVYVADSFTSTLSLIGGGAPLATGPNPAKGGDLAGVAVDPATHAVAFTSNNGSHSVTTLTIREPGQKPVVANLAAFEKTHNPDAANHYGTTSTNTCVTNALKKAGIPAAYRGLLDSHAYSVTAIGGGSWAVADAGGNDILRVTRTGHISLISVLPVQPVKISAAFAASQGLPKCVAGITYNFEPVPTDVEIGPPNALYVTTLPGGPEGPDSGNPGSVYRIANGGAPVRIATGFAGATNLALNPYGNIFVAQIGAGSIAEVVSGKPKVIAKLPGVAAVEFANGHLYASTAPAATGGKGPGSIVVLSH